ncbi:MAG: transglycosylase SLT domain-containing protein [Oscillospiraceae bacterium]|nr:transglycosylase SLT domain-containing protein [Oscillospiraceae bacterium]
MGNIAAMKVAEAMRGVQTRFAEIENLTGITFSAHLVRAQLHSASDVPFADLIEKPGADDADTELPSGASTSTASRTGGFSRMGESAYDPLFIDAAERYGLNAALIKAVAFAESTFRPSAVSQSGAMGLMQLMPFTAEALGVADPFDPQQSVDGGARVLSQHLTRFNGDALLALAAYNAGAAGVTNRGITDLRDADQRSLLPSETRAYLSRIEAYLDAAQASYVLDNPYNG